MFCRNCGEENPENAVFCRNCGAKLKEEVKKAEVIDTPVRTQNNNYNNNQQTTQTTTTKSSSSDSGSWIACCCVGLFLIFIISALFSGF